MTLTALILILLSIIFHASWHFLSKSDNPSYGFFIPFSGSIFLVMLPAMLYSGLNYFTVPTQVLIFAAMGGLSGAFCDIGLSYAYRYADISVAYPVARAMPVIMTALISAMFGLGASLNVTVLIAMCVIFIGCLMMPFKDLRSIKRKEIFNKGIYGIITAASGTTAYTLIDSYGIHSIMQAAPEGMSVFFIACSYSCMRESFGLTGLSAVIFSRKSERAKISCSLFKHWRPYCAGICAALAYVLVLIAMTDVTNVSYVQAFRQMSLPLGMILGIIFLHEKVTIQRIVAILLILGGLIAVYFA